MRTILFLILIAILLLGCEDSVAPKRYEEAPYLVINGKLFAGKPITLDRAIFVGRTSSADGADINQMIVTDASVVIYEVSPESGAMVSPVDSLAFRVDLTTDPIRMGFYDPDSTLIPVCGHTYRLVARIPGEADSVWAETRVPDEMTVMPDPSFTTDPTQPLPQILWETADSQHPLRAKLENSEQFNLFVQFYCLTESYEDVEWTIKIGSSDKPKDQDEYEDPASGQPRKIEFFYRAEPSWQDDGYYIRESRFKSFVWFYGPYRITYYSIDDNYFQYLFNTEGFYHGGIHNGLGYFGSVSGTVLYTEFTK